MIQTIGVIGSGTMGRGIAQIAATAGFQVALFDIKLGAAAEAVATVRSTLDSLTARGKFEPTTADMACKRLHSVTNLADLGHCDLLIEAIAEDLDAKRRLFSELENIVKSHAILATNTSSLSITEIASGCKSPERIAGLHFFNPVPLMRVVEVIPGFQTRSDVTLSLLEFSDRLGYRGVVARDTPGFIVNHAGRAYGTEALRLIEEGVADHSSVDRILRETAGFKMGPFELFDLTGLDVSHAATRAIFEQFYCEPRLKPSYLAQQRVSAGQFGRKTDRGFYEYPRTHGNGPHLQPKVATNAAPSSVWICPNSTFDLTELRQTILGLGGLITSATRCPEDALILIAPLGEDATTMAVRAECDPRRTVAIDLFCDLARHRTLMATPATDPAFAQAALDLFSGDPAGATLIRDSIGFVSQRVLAMVVNLASEIAQQGIASPTDIDDAVRLGLGYPLGPLTWGDALQPRRILTILETLHSISGDPRYRPSAWLRRRAILGLSLLHPD